jgi:hypothetical protein
MGDMAHHAPYDVCDPSARVYIVRTWELQRETELFAGWITGQVLGNLEPAEGELQQVLVRRDCPALAFPLDSSMRSKLAFQNRDSGRDYSD